jgi:hypothetical protein
MVTVAAVAGLALSPSGLARAEDAEGLQVDGISTTQHQGNTLQQASRLLPGGLEPLHLALARQSMALRHRRQSAGQLHALFGGVVPACFSFGSFSRLRAHAFGRLAAALSCSKASPLGFSGSRGEEVVRSGDVRSRRVAAVHLRVSLQRVLQLTKQKWLSSAKRSRILTGLGGFHAENNVGTYGTASTSSSTR